MPHTHLSLRFGIISLVLLAGCDSLPAPETFTWPNNYVAPPVDDTGEQPCEEQDWFKDGDGDGWGDASSVTSACEPPDGYVEQSGDCNDDDGSIHPDATEVCDDVDNDCDGAVDGEDDSLDTDTLSSFYEDADSDGYGNPDAQAYACSQPDGFVEDATDCNDDDASIHPGADVECTSEDRNCDGVADSSDEDGDGFKGCAGDCDDANEAIHPDATEVCDDVDNDCDELTDDEDESLDLETASTWYADADSDDWGNPDLSQRACEEPEGYTADNTDCNDADATLNNDDADSDGESSCDGDCDDADGTVYTTADEYCSDEVDSNCDGDDDINAVDMSTFYADTDSDGYGDPASTLDACEEPEGYTTDNTDCDDADATLNNDDVDSDGESTCDGDCDDADATLNNDDADSDGESSCDGDCDDADGTVYTTADEYCSDGVDSNCDGDDDIDAVDGSTFYADTDSDGYGDPASTQTACDAPTGYTTDNTDCDDSDFFMSWDDNDGDGYAGCDTTADCDDTDSSVYPGASESCDGIDSDCDGFNDIIGHWDFDDGSGSTLMDLSASEADGTISGASWSSSGDGVSGSSGDYALSFNGTSDYVSIPSTDVIPSSELTVCAWVMPDDISDGGTYTALGLGSSSTDYSSYWLGYEDTAVYGYTDESYATRSISDDVDVSTDHTDGNWHQICLTWDSGSSSRVLYVDGSQVDSDSSGPISLSSDGSDLYIGADLNSGSLENFFDGYIDEIQVLDCIVDTSYIEDAYVDGDSPL